MGSQKSQMRLSMHKYPIKMLISMMVQQVKNFPARRHKFDLESGKLQFKGLQKSQMCLSMHAHTHVTV